MFYSRVFNCFGRRMKNSVFKQAVFNWSETILVTKDLLYGIIVLTPTPKKKVAPDELLDVFELILLLSDNMCLLGTRRLS